MRILARGFSPTLCSILLITLNLFASQPALTQKSVPINAADVIWDATRSRLLVSTGSAVVVVNPDTAQVEDTVVSGPVVSRMAISDDGRYLYAALGSRGVVQRYDLRAHTLDLEISLGRDSQGRLITASTMAVLRGQPRSVLIARGYWVGFEPYFTPAYSQDVAVYDDSVPRAGTASMNLSSLYVRPSDGAIFAWGRSPSQQVYSGQGQIYSLAVSATGVKAVRSVPVNFQDNAMPNWKGSFVTDRSGTVVDLNAGVILGRSSAISGYALGPDSAETSLFAFQSDQQGPFVYSYSLATFRASGNVGVAGKVDILAGTNRPVTTLWGWGVDGFAVPGYDYAAGTPALILVQITGLNPVDLAPAPAPTTDSSGIIHIAVPASALTYDATRNLLWASVPGNQGQIGNSVVAIDPLTGVIQNSINAGSEPRHIALSSDGSRLFAVLGGAPSVSVIDVNKGQVEKIFSVQESGTLDNNYFQPSSLAPVAGVNTRVVVARVGGTYGSKITVYDAGQPLPQSVSNIQGLNTINDPAKLFDSVFPGDAANAFYAASAYTSVGGVNPYTNFAHTGHPLCRILSDDNGVHVDRQLTPLAIGDVLGTTATFLVYGNGKLFTGAGEVWSADTSQLLGRFASVGSPVLYLDRGHVLYFSPVQPTGAPFSVTLFDVATMRPTATYSFAWPGQTSSRSGPAVRAGADSVAIAVHGEILLIPLASLPSWKSYPANAQTVAPGVRRMDIPVKTMAAVPGTPRLLIATASTAGAIGNSVVTLNVETGQVEAATFAGSEPSRLAISPDGSTVYAALDGEQRMSRINLGSAVRDLVFTPDPTGNGGQALIDDMAFGADGGLALSYDGGVIAIFDNAIPRPAIATNTQGDFVGLPETLRLAFDASGTLLYGYNSFLSTFELKRFSVSQKGVNWLSGVGAVIGGYDTDIRYSGGLLYASNGAVADPERSRLVGRYVYPGPIGAALQRMALDPARSLVYFVVGQRIAVFNMATHDYLGSVPVVLQSQYYSSILSLVLVGDHTLAFHSSDGQLFLMDTSAIPLQTPVPSPQPSLPATPGVAVVDLSVRDLAYDPSRNLLYVSVPNREAALGDRIAAIDPDTGKVVTSYPAGRDPRLVALSGDQSQLYYTSGGFTDSNLYNSETVRALDLAKSVIGDPFAGTPHGTDSGYLIDDLAALQGQSQSVAVIDNLYQLTPVGGGENLLVNEGPASLRVYDGAKQRQNFLTPPALDCTSVQPGSSSTRLYCVSTKNFSKLTVDSTGVTLAASTPLSQSNIAGGRIVFDHGRIYSPSGLVLDA